MSDADNPYRFVEAVEQEESADATRSAVEPTYDGWDLRSYVAPKNEPIYSPAEIAELGKRWSGMTLTTLVGLVILTVLVSLLLMPGPSGAGTIRNAVVAWGFFSLGAFALQVLVAREAYVLLRALRYSRYVAIVSAAAYVLPGTNLLLLLSLGTEAIVTLRRHGIPAGLWRAGTRFLPRRIEGTKETDR